MSVKIVWREQAESRVVMLGVGLHAEEIEQVTVRKRTRTFEGLLIRGRAKMTRLQLGLRIAMDDAINRRNP